jgi:single-strand DNA-binding protein
MKMLGSRQGMGAPGSSGGGGGYDNEPTDYAPAPAKNKPKPSFDDLGDDIPF